MKFMFSIDQKGEEIEKQLTHPICHGVLENQAGCLYNTEIPKAPCSPTISELDLKSILLASLYAFKPAFKKAGVA